MMFWKIFFLILPTVLPYHFYNPNTHDVLTQSSLNNVPHGYRLLPPPKNNHGSFERGKRNGYCTDPGFICNAPFSKSITFQFECDEDYQCPKSYKCCQHKCFLHKVCSKASSTVPNPNGSNNNRPGICEKWPYNCQRPYDYSLTSIFKCNSDRQCPKNFKCCQQSCFVHRICSREVPVISSETYKRKKGRKEEAVENLVLVSEVTTEKESEYYDENETETEEATEANTDEVTETEIEEIIENETEETTEEDYDNVQTEETTEITDTTETTESTVEVTTLLEISSEKDNSDLNIISDKSRKNNFSIIVAQKKTTPSLSKLAPDGNAIVPEYAEYYYHYGNGNDTYEYEEYDEDEDEDTDD